MDGGRSGWTVGHVIGMVLASIVGVTGLATLVGGLAVLGAYAFATDDDGYFTTPRERLQSGAYAITTEDIDLGTDEGDWAPDGVLGDVRIQAYGGRTPVFVGIGRESDVDRYLAGVAHDELTDIHHGEAEFRRSPGREAPAPPGRQRFWVARSQGRGERSVTWDVDLGRWKAVVMNAEAARGIDVEADAGFKLGWGMWVGVGLLVAGLTIGAAAAAVIVLIGRSADARRGSG